jgi:hypothetical protein
VAVHDPLQTLLVTYQEMYQWSLYWYKLAREAGMLEKISEAIEEATEAPMLAGSAKNYGKWLEARAHEVWEWAVEEQTEYDNRMLPDIRTLSFVYYEVFERIVPVEIWRPTKCAFVGWTEKGTTFNCGTGPITISGFEE